MEITIIAETSGDGLHPVTGQLVGAAGSLGGPITVLCPGGRGASEASDISGVSKVISWKEIVSILSIVELGLLLWLPVHKEQS